MPLLGTQNHENMGATDPESGEVLVLQTSNITALFRPIYDEGMLFLFSSEISPLLPISQTACRYLGQFQGIRYR
jgi:hypothetical protein